MGTAEIICVRMREDELLARIRYHEDRLQRVERLAAFHRAAGEAARNDLTALQQPSGPEALLVPLTVFRVVESLPGTIFRDD